MRGVCLWRVGSSPTARTIILPDCVRVAQVTLTHFVWVRILVRQPKIDILRQRNVDFTYYLFTLHYSLKITFVDFEVISNSEKGRSMVQTRFGEFDLQGEFLWTVRYLQDQNSLH